MTTSDPPIIYTIGYAGWAPDGLRDEVRRLGAALVDVRIAPTSKSPQWRKDNLAALLGPIYRHLPELGNRNAFTGGAPALNAPERAVAPIAALLVHGPVILLCGRVLKPGGTPTGSRIRTNRLDGHRGVTLSAAADRAWA